MGGTPSKDICSFSVLGTAKDSILLSPEAETTMPQQENLKMKSAHTRSETPVTIQGLESIQGIDSVQSSSDDSNTKADGADSNEPVVTDLRASLLDTDLSFNSMLSERLEV